MDEPLPGPDPLIERLKARQKHRDLATTPSHLLSVVLVLAAALLLIVGSLRPFTVLYEISNPAILGHDADAALATVLVAGGVIELVACGATIWGIRRRGRAPRFVHLTSVPVSFFCALLWYLRYQTNDFRISVANRDENVPPSHFGDGTWITAAGLALGVVAVVVALPAARRVWRT